MGRGQTPQGENAALGSRREERLPELGRLRPPFPVEHCANIDCPHDPDPEHTTLHEHGAYLYRDLTTNKLVVFCGDCAMHAELNAPERFKLIAL